jgi:hypothetical protein
MTECVIANPPKSAHLPQNAALSIDAIHQTQECKKHGGRHPVDRLSLSYADCAKQPKLICYRSGREVSPWLTVIGFARSTTNNQS